MTGDARHLYMRTLGQQFAREDRHGELKQLSMVSEAWMSLPKGGKLPAYRPSQDPDRTEVLIITQLTVATRACQMAIYRMVRDQAGTLATLETIGLPGAVTAESPLLEAFLEGYAQATTPHPLGQTVSLLSTAGRRWAPTRPALRRVRYRAISEGAAAPENQEFDLNRGWASNSIGYSVALESVLNKNMQRKNMLLKIYMIARTE
jgi:hypothetical protein